MARKPKTLAVRKRRYAKKYMRRRKITRFATTKMIYKARLQATTLAFTIPIAATTTAYSFVFQVSLSDIVSNEITAFTNLYDEFKISGFTWTLAPRGNIANSAPADPAVTGTLQKGFHYYSVLDHSDANTLSTVNQALEYASCRRHNSWTRAKRYVPAYCPRLTRDVSDNPMLVVEKPKWLQLSTQTIAGTVYNQLNVDHIGCKIICETNYNNDEVIFDLYTNINVMFRNKL